MLPVASEGKDFPLAVAILMATYVASQPAMYNACIHYRWAESTMAGRKVGWTVRSRWTYKGVDLNRFERHIFWSVRHSEVVERSRAGGSAGR